jgi:hypothetical protein
MMLDQSTTYHSFILRIWQQDGEWHATLQDVKSGECEHFATLLKLYVKLCEITSVTCHESFQ